MAVDMNQLAAEDAAYAKQATAEGNAQQSQDAQAKQPPTLNSLGTADRGHVTGSAIDGILGEIEQWGTAAKRVGQDAVAGATTGAANVADTAVKAAQGGAYGALPPEVRADVEQNDVLGNMWDHAKSAIMDFRDAVAVKDPNIVDGVTQAGAQLIGPFAAYSKALTGLRGLANTVAAGAATDMTALQPHDMRTADLIALGRQTDSKIGAALRAAGPYGLNAYVNFLADRTNESDAEGRFKNALDGLGTNLVMTPLLHAAGIVVKQGQTALRGLAGEGVTSASDLVPKAPPAEPATPAADRRGTDRMEDDEYFGLLRKMQSGTLGPDEQVKLIKALNRGPYKQSGASSAEISQQQAAQSAGTTPATADSEFMAEPTPIGTKPNADRLDAMADQAHGAWVDSGYKDDDAFQRAWDLRGQAASAKQRAAADAATKAGKVADIFDGFGPKLAPGTRISATHGLKFPDPVDATIVGHRTPLRNNLTGETFIPHLAEFPGGEVRSVTRHDIQQVYAPRAVPDIPAEEAPKGWGETGGGTSVEDSSSLNSSPGTKAFSSVLQATMDNPTGAPLSKLSSALQEHLPNDAEGDFYREVLQRVGANNPETKVFTHSEEYSHPVNTAGTPSGNIHGNYQRSDDTLHIYPGAFRNPARLTQVFAHEAVHAATVKTLDNSPRVYSDFQQLIRQASDSAAPQGDTKTLSKADQYGFKNPHEFVAEIESNPRFREAMQNTRPFDKTGYPAKSGPTIWDLYKDKIAGILGVGGVVSTSPLFEKLLSKGEEKNGA